MSNNLMEFVIAVINNKLKPMSYCILQNCSSKIEFSLSEELFSLMSISSKCSFFYLYKTFTSEVAANKTFKTKKYDVLLIVSFNVFYHSCGVFSNTVDSR